MRASALIVEVAWVEPLVGTWRARFVPVARRGIPAHVTILHPFRSPGSIDRAAIDVLDRICAGMPSPWALSLVDVGSFPDAVWLRLDPVEPFVVLSNAVFGAFPDCPPHGGRWDPPLVPHLTIAHDPDPHLIAELRLAAATEFGEGLPAAGIVEALSLFVSDDDGNWSRQQRFPFGGVTAQHS